MEVCIFGVLTVNLLTPILIFSFQSASFYLDECLILRQIRDLNDDQREASMMPHEGAINASRRKNWCVATQKIMHRDGKKQPFYSHFSSYRDAFLIFSTGKLLVANRKTMS